VNYGKLFLEIVFLLAQRFREFDGAIDLIFQVRKLFQA
jgi:hypothetical protein